MVGIVDPDPATRPPSDTIPASAVAPGTSKGASTAADDPVEMLCVAGQLRTFKLEADLELTVRWWGGEEKN